MNTSMFDFTWAFLELLLDWWVWVIWAAKELPAFAANARAIPIYLLANSFASIQKSVVLLLQQLLLYAPLAVSRHKIGVSMHCNSQLRVHYSQCNSIIVDKHTCI